LAHLPTAAEAKLSSRRFVFQNPRSARRDHDLMILARSRIEFDATPVGLIAPPTPPSRHFVASAASAALAGKPGKHRDPHHVGVGIGVDLAGIPAPQELLPADAQVLASLFIKQLSTSLLVQLANLDLGVRFGRHCFFRIPDAPGGSCH
jgi:hypothetical protein